MINHCREHHRELSAGGYTDFLGHSDFQVRFSKCSQGRNKRLIAPAVAPSSMGLRSAG